MKIDKNSYEKIATQIVMKHQEAPFGLPLPTGRTYGSQLVGQAVLLTH